MNKIAKTALVILAEGFEEIESNTVIDILRRADVKVTVAGLGGTKIKGSRDMTVVTDTELSEAGTDFDALILPGGQPGADNLHDSKLVNDLIHMFNRENKLVAAICASPAVVLAPTGVLGGKKATCYPGLEDNFPGDVILEDMKVVEDGNIITSRGPATAMAFSLNIVERLAGKSIRENVAAGLLFT
ncbi:MAG: DJ-1 family glyoxalase III [Elusimicrobiota bacterium]